MRHQQVFPRSHKQSALTGPAFAAMVALAVALPSALFAETRVPPPVPGVHQELTAAQRQLVDEVLAAEHPYGCCSETLKVCLEKKPLCPLVARLHRAITRMAGQGASKAQIQLVLAQRKATMRADGAIATIAADDQFRAGNPKAPVTLAIYACPRNETCAKMIPDVYREVTTGRLKDKATLVYRPFFPTDDAETLECGRGLYAAAYQGQFWPYLVHLCLERERLSQATIRDWATSHGLDRCVFDQTCEQASTASWLQAARKEALANGVTAAPAVFIDGRRIQGSVDLETLVDLAKEEQEALTAQKQAPAGAPNQAPPPRGGKRP
jgi:protein-disulfide isomerase